MIRTQIYLPEELHKTAKKFAKLHSRTLSEIIRESLQEYIKRKRVNEMENKAFEFFAHPPKSYQINLRGKKLIEIIRKERDEK